VQKKFLIAFGAGQAAGEHFHASETRGFGAFSDAGDGFFVQANILDDSAGTDIFAGEFELGFDENEKNRAGFCTSGSRTKYFANGNKRYVGDNEIDWFGDVSGSQFARVAFDDGDARISLEFPGELREVYIDGVDPGGAMLKKAICEAARRAANVKTNEVCWIDLKIFQGTSSFKPPRLAYFN